MGRLGVTAVDIEKAALQLQGQGKNPTVDGIREFLGTGSKGTIAQHLKTWRAKQGEAQGKLPYELTSLVSGLWERLNSQAEERIISIENTHEKTLHELKHLLAQSQQEQAQLKVKLHQQEEIYRAEHQTRETLEKNLQKEQQEHAKLQESYKAITQQLDDSKSENGRLHQLAKQIQANLEHYQAAMQQQRIEQALTIEKQQIQFQQEISFLRQELAEQQSKTQQIKNDLSQKAVLLEQSQQQKCLLQQNYDELSKTHQEMDRELIITKERSNQHQRQLEINVDELIHKNQRLIVLEKEIAILTNENKSIKTDYANMAEKIEILRHEKMFLAQEKSELMGQLKQLNHDKNKKETV